MRRILSLGALSLLAVSMSASAQQRSRSGASMENPSPEIGIDAGISFGLGTPSFTVISIPAQQIRMGFFMTPELSIEPTFGLTSVSGGGGGSFTIYSLGAGLLYHFSTSRAANQFYVRPFAGIVGTSGGGVASNSDGVFGIGGGLKVPLRQQIASRFEANFSHSNGENAIGLLAGLSFYTR